METMIPRRYILLGTQEGVLGVLDVVTAPPYHWWSYTHTGDEAATRANLKTLAAVQDRHPGRVVAAAFLDDKFGPKFAHDWAQGKWCCEQHRHDVGGCHPLCERPTPDWHIWGCGVVNGVRYIGPHRGETWAECVEQALQMGVRA